MEQEYITRDSCVLVDRQVSQMEQQTPEWELPMNSALARIEQKKLAWKLGSEFYHKGTLGYFLKLSLKPQQFQKFMQGKLKFSSGQIYAFTYKGIRHKGCFI